LNVLSLNEYRPFCDLRCVPEAARPREQAENHGRACTKVLFLRKAELGFFHFLEIVRGWLVPSAAGQKIPVHPGGYRPPPHKIPLAENRFLQAYIRELKIQRKNPGKCFTNSEMI
jgi:hypothetical protein